MAESSSPTPEPRTFLRLEARDPDSDPSPAAARATNYLILQSHVALKGAQAGAIVGPLATWARYRGRATAMQLVRGGVAWTGWTAVVALLAGVGRVWKAEPYEIYDRAYRLNNNLSQNRVDKISLVSAGIGAILGSLVLPAVIPLRTRILAGAVEGLAGGVVVHVISAAAWKVDEKELKKVEGRGEEFREKNREEGKPEAGKFGEA